MDANVRETYWTNIQKPDTGAGNGTPTTDAFDGAGDASDEHDYRVD
jgi:hypothetical protein